MVNVVVAVLPRSPACSAEEAEVATCELETVPATAESDETELVEPNSLKLVEPACDANTDSLVEVEALGAVDKLSELISSESTLVVFSLDDPEVEVDSLVELNPLKEAETDSLVEIN